MPEQGGKGALPSSRYSAFNSAGSPKTSVQSKGFKNGRESSPHSCCARIAVLAALVGVFAQSDIIGCPQALCQVIAAGFSARTRLDSYGDPLPDKALMRIGTNRFRGGGERLPVFTPDGKSIAVCGSGHLCGATTVSLMRCSDGLIFRDFENRLTMWSEYSAVEFTPDGKHLIAAACSDELRPPIRSYVHVWNVDTGREVWSAKLDRLCISLAVSPSGRLIADRPEVVALILGKHPERPTATTLRRRVERCGASRSASPPFHFQRS